MAEESEEVLQTFEELRICDELAESCDELGWKNPSTIQAEAIPHTLDGKDLTGLAQTGSGKNGAFVLPILQALLENPQSFFACVLCPTRELTFQIFDQFEAIGSEIGVKCVLLLGGGSFRQDSINLAKQPHIIVGTPGRLMDHLNRKSFPFRMLKFLVLDEADRLMSEGYEETLYEILKVIPCDRTYLFSATMTKKMKKLRRARLRSPVKVKKYTSRPKFVINNTSPDLE
ncbi:hypothetical protein F8388_018298 [Cannabis sativa]|uniref:Uncharacterized protein n=1 Tax=Cannabis sativa TaxID=3483 RepID=A0A7J6EJA8_CANSA|nr:hypothetical protein F8388_018298 [Cannabis sativa]